MAILSQLRWRWVIIAAFAAEVALVPLTMSLGFIVTSNGWPTWAGDLSFNAIMVVALFPAGYWAARKAGARFVLHGAAVGALAALIFLPALLLGLAGDALHETINEFLKVAGGAAGGWLARHRHCAVQPPSIS